MIAATHTITPITKGQVPRDAARDEDPLVAELLDCRFFCLLPCMHIKCAVHVM